MKILLLYLYIAGVINHRIIFCCENNTDNVGLWFLACLWPVYPLAACVWAGVLWICKERASKEAKK